MKKLLFLLLVWIYPIVSFSAIDECKTDVYYANGILATQGEAKDISEEVLKLAILEKVYGGNIEEFNKDIGEVGYSYNQTNGFIFDGIETYAQKLNIQGFIDAWALLKGYITSHAEDYLTHYNKYVARIKDGHRVLVVAHSQGNLFTNEIYKRLGQESKNGWMQDYFGAVSVASPMKADITEDTERITWDNDLVGRYIAHNGTSDPDEVPNPVRALEEKPYLMTNPNFDCLQKVDPYVKKEDLGKLVCNTYEAVEVSSSIIGNMDPYFNVHAFTFYMGEPLAEDAKGTCTGIFFKTCEKIRREFYDPFDMNNTLQTNEAKDLIMGAVDRKLEQLKKVPSQWEPKNLGCLCKEKYAKLTHAYDPENIKFPATNRVKDFSEKETGKIYQVDGEYVRANCGGFKIEAIDEDEACYVLKDDTPTELGKIKGLKEEPITQDGIITAKLIWEDSEIDMNLEVGMPFGEQDIKDIGCPLEHFHVATEEDVEPGIYPVYVRATTSDIDESVIPQKVDLVIHTPGEAMTFDFDITSVDMLNIGHVANIIIEEDKQVHFVSTSITSGGGSSPIPKVTHYGGGGANAQPYTYFVYSIQSKLKQALMGPLSNAVVKLTPAEDFENNEALYVGATSGGESVVTSGVLYFPSEFLSALDDEKLYVISVIGGNDIDADDNGKLDSVVTPSDGTIHVILSGEKLKNENFKVTILTEVVYQLTKDMLTNELNTTTVLKKMEYLSKKLLKEDVDKNGIINYDDISWWVPIYDKLKLQKNYTINYQPIAEKIYRDETIYNESKELIKVPYPMTVNEDATKGTVIGEIAINFDGNITVHTLLGVNNEHFTINPNGTLVLADNDLLDYETLSRYRLNVVVNDGYGNNFLENIDVSINNVIEHAPVLKLSTSAGIAEDSHIGTVVMQIGTGGSNLDENSVDSYKIVNENIENIFQIDDNGVITLIAPLDFETKKIYWFDVVAINAAGESNPVRYIVNVTNVIDGEPVLNEMNFEISEHATIGAIVGTVEVNTTGVSSIEYMTLSGVGAQKFNIDKNGIIKVADTLDYESKKIYTLNVSATSQFGTSEMVKLTIIINNILEVPPVLHDINVTLKSNIAVDTVVGNILKEAGDTPIDELVVSGMDMFGIDTNGDIYCSKHAS